MAPTEDQKRELKNVRVSLMRLPDSIHYTIEALTILGKRPGVDKRAIGNAISKMHLAESVLERCGEERSPNNLRRKIVAGEVSKPKGVIGKVKGVFTKDKFEKLRDIRRKMANVANMLAKELELINEEEQKIKAMLTETKSLLHRAGTGSDLMNVIHSFNSNFNELSDIIFKKLNKPLAKLAEMEKNRRRVLTLITEELEKELVGTERELIKELRQKSLERATGLAITKIKSMDEIKGIMESIRNITVDINKKSREPIPDINVFADEVFQQAHEIENKLLQMQEILDEMRDILVKEIRYYRRVDRPAIMNVMRALGKGHDEAMELMEKEVEAE